MTDEETVETLTRLGLTTYGARVFVALQKLGTATASEVSDVADVPRSQVYSAAEDLEERGLVEVQQTTPTRYRPVPLEQARERLLRDLEREGERAFEHLQSVQGSREGREQRSQAVWTVTDAEAIAVRVAELAGAADDRLFYGVSDADQLEPRVLEALEACAARGVTVVVTSEDPDARAALDDVDGVAAFEIPGEDAPGSGRYLVADRDGVLLSVVGPAYVPDGDGETAIWSDDTAFAAVIVSLVEEWLAAHLPVEDLDGELVDR